MWLSKPPAGIQLNRNHPLAQGLVGCWLFNEGSGLRANDLSGNNNTGILTNFEPMSATQGWTGGNTGTSLAFPGVNATSYVNCSNTPSVNFGLGNFSISALIYPTSITGALAINSKMIVDKKQEDTNNRGFYLRIFNADSKFNVKLASGVANTVYASTSLANINTWQLITVTANRTERIRFYINGVLDNSISMAATSAYNLTGNDNLVIGESSTGSVDSFQGRISHEMLWNRALSSQEVQQLYAQPYAMFWNPSEKTRKHYDNELLI